MFALPVSVDSPVFCMTAAAGTWAIIVLAKGACLPLLFRCTFGCTSIRYSCWKMVWMEANYQSFRDPKVSFFLGGGRLSIRQLGSKLRMGSLFSFSWPNYWCALASKGRSLSMMQRIGLILCWLSPAWWTCSSFCHSPKERISRASSCCEPCLCYHCFIPGHTPPPRLHLNELSVSHPRNGKGLEVAACHPLGPHLQAGHNVIADCRSEELNRNLSRNYAAPNSQPPTLTSAVKVGSFADCECWWKHAIAFYHPWDGQWCCWWFLCGWELWFWATYCRTSSRLLGQTISIRLYNMYLSVSLL